WLNRALAAGATVTTSDDVLARFTLHPGSKSNDYMARFKEEQIRLYLRLSVRPDFRFVPCVLSAVKPFQRLLAFRALNAATRNARGKAALLAASSRAVKGVWRGARSVAGLESRLAPGEQA